MAKVFINPGHGANDSGAVNKALNLQERTIAKAIGEALSKILEASGIQTEVYQQIKTLNEVPKKANASGADLLVSIHMNAPATTNGGVEVLYCEGSTKGKDVAQTVLNSILKVGDYTFKNRGIKDDSARHLCVLRYPKMTCCLVEMGFITYNKEAIFVSKHTSECAYAIAQGIKAYLSKIGKLNNTSPSVVAQPSTTKPKVEIAIVPSGKDNKFNLLVNNTLILKENSLETLHKYLLEKYKDCLYS